MSIPWRVHCCSDLAINTTAVGVWREALCARFVIIVFLPDRVSVFSNVRLERLPSWSGE